MNPRNSTLIGLVLAIVLFFAVNILANASLRSMRMDLTEDKVFTLEEGSKRIAKDIDEPIHLTFYFSREKARDYPSVLEYAERVLGFLHEYERASGGKIQLSVVDPEPFSEEEDRAVEQGIAAAQLPDGDVIYFGLVGTGATDVRDSIPFFALDEEKQRTLEYDISKLVWNLAHPNKKHLGILTALPLEGGGGNPMMGQREPPWTILEALGDFFQVEVLPQSGADLSEIDALAVIHPRGFSDETLYQIDQWALAGKPLVVFVDPRCEADPGAVDDPSNPMSQYMADKSSNLEKLFTAWGISMAKDKVVCDRALGVRQAVRSPDGRSQTELPVVFFLQLGKEEVSTEDPVTRLLSNLLLVTPGSLAKLEAGTTTFTPILQTSEESDEVESTQFQFSPDPQALLASFVPGYQRLTLGARVTGNVKTAFPDGKPGATPEPVEEGAEPPPSDGLKESTGPLNLLVFSDADLLSDRMWVRQLRIGSQVIPQLLSENADLLKNAVDSACGGQELMAIRTRGKTSRPFEKVKGIQRDADQRFLARQQELERKLEDADRRLRELQKAKAEGSEDMVTAEQRKEEEKVREEFVQTRRDLRDVKYQLHKDIDGLGRSLKWLNIALMPALVCAAAVALGAWRMQQRSRK